AKLQSDSLIEQNAFELSHLRWRRFNDQMKGAPQIMAVAVGAMIVAGIGAAMWNASQADGLVVDSFSVPPSFVAAGMTGDVVADDMTNKIAAVHDFANDHSLARSKDVREDRSQDIKVEIPETGVSFAEAWRYLRQWLGHEQHLGGNIRALPDGHIALTVSLGDANTFTFTGAPSDLEKLEEQAAERVFGVVDPVNIVLYWSGKRRPAETLAAAQRLVALGGDTRTLSESYSLYANMSRYIEGDVRHSAALAEFSIALDPKPAPQHMELLNSSRALGHDEVVLQQARVIATLRQEDNVGAWKVGEGLPYVWQLGALYRALETGDYADAATQRCIHSCSLTEDALQRADVEALRHDPRTAKAFVAKAMVIGEPDPFDVASAKYDIHVAEGDWRAAISDARAKGGVLMSGLDDTYTKFQAAYDRAVVTPQLATTLAKTGDFAGAWSAIDATAGDCYNCVRARGNIAALQKDWGKAEYWFADAVKQAPSIPFAYVDWGRMLMAKGDLDGAIAKFESAHQKGPHFADPLEMWGEVLIAKNRSDLALARFEEASKYAPNWKRLHQKWGEALSYLGRNDDAAKQFALARSLGG
ncbi:MAG TPA: tetratricopeptide repeat protein, partial [Rhizomicrobium sp.]|nr:tetratricopeptide repeat protein [Rhizomicrobium sp.]